MAKKRKHSQNDPSFNRIPLRGFGIGLLCFIVIMFMFRDYFLRIAIPMIYPILGFAALGWLIGWGIKFYTAPKRYTGRGISLSLAQFMLSVVNILFFSVTFAAFFFVVSLIFSISDNLNMLPDYLYIVFAIIVIPISLWVVVFVIGILKLARFVSQQLGMTEEEYRRTMGAVSESSKIKQNAL